MKTEEFLGGICPVCGQSLVYEEGAENCFNNDSVYVDEDGVCNEGDVDMNREITCQNCGCHVIAWHYDGQDSDAGFAGPVGDQGFGNCFICGSTLVWGNDFMRKDLEPDIDNEADDSLVRELTCAGCGTAYTVYEPSLNEMKKYPYWKDVDPVGEVNKVLQHELDVQNAADAEPVRPISE